ncbi:MAG: UvrD-helicase domain-containing protein [Candidatus Brocadiaceae bacterium]|nr:UvrD-helicase domain-containing protein [Candidatus Brocadiaceae bacterium]
MSLLKDVTDKQREAIVHTEGPLLVVAGAGSGKTRVITRRVGYLMSQGVYPYNILAITFTNKAANEMSERIKVFSSHKGLWISTFHKMCSRILRNSIDRIGYSRDFSIYDTADQLNRVKSVMAELQMDTAQWKPRSIMSTISNAKNKLIDADTFAATASGYYNLTVSRIYAKYQALLHTDNALDFDDLLMKTILLLKEHPDILEMYQDKFRFILVDEYQDTNYAQYTITQLLANKHRNICVTGDPDQSIYGWRGADIQNIMDFEKDYPDAKVVLLEQNYRSTKHILRAASGIIQQNKYRKQKNIWTENSPGEKVKAIRCENEYKEADEIAQTIKALRNKGIKYSNIAVFYRTNAQSRVLEISLRNNGIPYMIIGGVEFYRRKEIKDILAYLRLCVNPSDEMAMERTINIPARGIGNTTIKKLKDWATEHHAGLCYAMQHLDKIPDIRGKSASSLKKYYELISYLQQSPKSSVEDILRIVIEKTNYIEFLRKSEEKESTDRIANIEELVNAAHEYDLNVPEGSLLGFLEEVALVSDLDAMEEHVEAVTLMTLHTAKGLEFPYVFIAGMVEGLLPHSESSDSDNKIEEERRLCYVGITRAMKELYFTYAKRRTRYGQMTPCIASRFLDEIPDEILDTIDKTSRDYSYEFYFTRNRASQESGFSPEKDLNEVKSALPTENSFSFSSGERVRHPIFGTGRILEVNGKNEKASVKVNFTVGGTKHLMLAYARLEKIE